MDIHARSSSNPDRTGLDEMMKLMMTVLLLYLPSTIRFK